MRVERGAVAYWSKPASHLEQVLVNRADKEDSRSPFSFMNLIEAYVVTSLRRVHGMKMSKIRSAVDWLKEKYPAQKYPLANNKLITDGLELFIEESGEIVSATRKGQVSIRSIISPYLNRIEWADDDLPIAFYPFTSNVKGPALVTIDPAIQFGLRLSEIPASKRILLPRDSAPANPLPCLPRSIPFKPKPLRKQFGAKGCKKAPDRSRL